MPIKIPFDDLPTSTFACGPGQGHPVFRETPLYRTLFERAHRAPDISTQGLYSRTEQQLRTLLNIVHDYTVIFFLGGATPAVDAVAWSLTKNSISGLSFGAFSKRWCQQISACLEPTVLKDFAETKNDEAFPSTDPNFQASLVLLTPNETSTGVHIPDEYLERAWHIKGEETLIAWDCTSCAGGRVLPKNKFDVMVFSLQKCFGAGGGSSVLILSPKAVQRIEEAKKLRRIPYSLDLSYAVEKAQKYCQTFNTPNTTNIWLLHQACQWMNENGGLPAMENLCRRHAQHMIDGAQKTDWIKPMIADEAYRSFTTLTLQITDPSISAEAINAALRETGAPNLQDGLKRYTGAPTNSLRVACFPFVDINGTEQYQKLTDLLDEIVRQIRRK